MSYQDVYQMCIRDSNESISNPKLDYKVLLHLTGYLTQDSQQVDEMFQRMVFNVLTDLSLIHISGANNTALASSASAISSGCSLK